MSFDPLGAQKAIQEARGLLSELQVLVTCTAGELHGILDRLDGTAIVGPGDAPMFTLRVPKLQPKEDPRS